MGSFTGLASIYRLEARTGFRAFKICADDDAPNTGSEYEDGVWWIDSGGCSPSVRETIPDFVELWSGFSQMGAFCRGSTHGVVVRPFPTNKGQLSGPDHEDREMENPVQFLQEVRAEGAKVTWPTRKETLVTTGGVFMMVLAASAFFFLADQVLGVLVGFIIGIGR